ncbi:MAG: NAD(P)H-hydrate dehydratase [Elusimicrobia bacterium RIFOXYB2_FULL_62_6]|nr:MAG: NAD(P)H-hydrate dehydratase [Elusimicrobia bacterium RIFOXYB2_FULL_62_6]
MKIKKITAGYLQPLLLPRKKNSHKGDYGRVLIVAGSRGVTGAAVLSARAALKAGAGLVTVACPDSEQPVIAAGVPEATTLPLPSKDGGFALRAAAALTAFREGIKFDLLLIGPGLSVKGEVPAFVAAVLRKPGLPAVIDADALNALALRGNLDFLKKSPPKIFTPHSGEAARLLRAVKAGRLATVEKLAALTGGTCVLKGPGTLVSDGRTCLVNPTGGPALAKGGSGDVLAGLIAGLWAQKGRAEGFSAANALECAALGVYLHGLCGDLAAEKLTSRCVLAGELLKFLPAAFRTLKAV